MQHPYRELVGRVYVAFRFSLLAFAVIMVIGTIGYWEISGGKATVLDCAYMTFITIATIGYGEVIDLSQSPGGRVFTMLIGFCGVANIFYMTSKMTAFIVESDLNESLRRHRMERDIEGLKGHYIVCGIGRVGTNVLNELAATGRQSVVIEPEKNALDAMLEVYPKQRYLHGDGGDDALLKAAGVAHAAGVFAVSGDDNKNLVITLSAKQLNPKVRVVARCHEVRFVDKIRRVGADDIVSPDFTGALRIASSMLRPAVVSFLDEMLRSDQGLRVEEIEVPQGARERRIAELAPADTDYVVLAVRRDGRWEFNPAHESTAKPGATLVVMATPAGRAKLERRVAA
ncbi:MAG TPA: NAD-binding protein [Burkholderiales bacterium]|jgi:voltage-gated potassium channel|nr:NAD-binding protein [Burkholderiales bacterium]